MSSTQVLYHLKCTAPGSKVFLAFSLAGVIEFIPGNVYVTSDYDEVLKAVQSGYFVVVDQPKTESVEAEAEAASDEANVPAAPTSHRRPRGS